MSESVVQDVPVAAGHETYTRNNPYRSRVLVNELLTAEGSEKETRHVELALEPGMTYTPGDAVGIIPENRREVVEEVLAVLGFTGEERVLDHYKNEIGFAEALRTRLATGKLTRSSVTQFAKLAPGNEKLKSMTGPEGKALAEEYCYGREFVDLAQEFPGVVTQPQQMFQVVARLTPRMYSIASSQARFSDTVQTTVRVVRYEAHGRQRQGLASGHLGERAPVGSEMPIFLHANQNFRLPEDTAAPVIMFLPRTGIAPFRAFLEERQMTGAAGNNWLFFGEQRKALDFLYREELEGMHREGVLTRLDTAFSRDQARKVYVQDRMAEHSAELWDWLELGAYFYVCGDATRMAKDVETALLAAIAKGSGGTVEAAEEYLQRMKKEKRYQRDVY